MKRTISLLFFVFSLWQFALGQDTISTPNDTRPNILLIVADDLGYSDIGAYGGGVETPFLDKIAGQSICFSNFHTLPTCAPTRSVLLTGTDNHLAGFGTQAKTKKQEGKPGYEGYLNNRVVLLPEILRGANYRTYLSGKWHLGDEGKHFPYHKGFQETFALMPGGASHYGDQKAINPAEPCVYRRNGKIVQTLPNDFYSTKNYTDSLLSWIERDKNAEQPFFAYLAYTAPHDPLHAPKKYVNKYKGVYEEGYEILRKKRFEGLKKRGLIAASQTLPNWPKIIPSWSYLSEKEKQESIRDMEIYSAMIDYMDEQIGRIYTWLETNEALDNTIIIFMSDNGASGLNSKKLYPGYTKEFDSQFNNELANRGYPNSFTNLPTGWAVATTALYRDFKASTREGGIRTPMFIKSATPTRMSVQNNTDRNVCSTFTHVSDILPTILDVTNLQHPSTANSDLVKIRGKSLVPVLENPSIDIYKGKGKGYEQHGARAFIKDGWKIFQTPIPAGSGNWELYNLKEDPGEQVNLIFKHWDKFQALLAEHKAYEKEVGVVYALPKVLQKVNSVYNIIFGLLIAIFGIAILGKLSGKLKDRYIKWGYGVTVMYALAIVELIAVGGLFTIINQYAAQFLVVIMGGAFFTLIKNQANWKAYSLPLLTTILLGLFLLLKSGWFTRLML